MGALRCGIGKVDRPDGDLHMQIYARAAADKETVSQIMGSHLKATDSCDRELAADGEKYFAESIPGSILRASFSIRNAMDLLCMASVSRKRMHALLNLAKLVYLGCTTHSTPMHSGVLHSAPSLVRTCPCRKLSDVADIARLP